MHTYECEPFKSCCTNKIPVLRAESLGDLPPRVSRGLAPEGLLFRCGEALTRAAPILRGLAAWELLLSLLPCAPCPASWNHEDETQSRSQASVMSGTPGSHAQRQFSRNLHMTSGSRICFDIAEPWLAEGLGRRRGD